MDKAKIIARIRKLLALANSPVPEEAASAMAKAQELMAEYAIEQEALDLSDMGEVQAEFQFSHAVHPSAYAVRLAVRCADAFGVHKIWYGSCPRFYGDKGRAALCAYAFTVLGRQCAKARKAFYRAQNKRTKRSTRIGRADQFADGWVISATKLLRDAKIGENECALICLFAEQQYPGAGTLKPRNAKRVRGADDAFSNGFFEGRNARLDTALNGGRSTPFLGS